MTDEILKEIDRRKSSLEGDCSCDDSENIPYRNHFMECPGYSIECLEALRVAADALIHIEGVCVKRDSLGVCDCPNIERGLSEDLKEIAAILGVKHGDNQEFILPEEKGEL